MLVYLLDFGKDPLFHDLEDVGTAPSAGEKTLVLYGAASGSLPGLPLMSFSNFPPGAALPSYLDDAAASDTTTAAFTFSNQPGNASAYG